MNILRSVAGHGLVAMPPMVDTSHVHVSDRRLVVPDGTADPSHLAWLQRGATERSVARTSLRASVASFGSWFLRGRWRSLPSARTSSTV